MPLETPANWEPARPPPILLVNGSRSRTDPRPGGGIHQRGKEPDSCATSSAVRSPAQQCSPSPPPAPSQEQRTPPHTFPTLRSPSREQRTPPQTLPTMPPQTLPTAPP